MALTATEVRFVNEQIRPAAERLRALQAELAAMLTTWHNGIGAAMTADLAAAVDDGREAEGVSRLTANDVVNLMSAVIDVQAALNEVGRAAVIAKPCVRPLRID